MKSLLTSLFIGVAGTLLAERFLARLKAPSPLGERFARDPDRTPGTKADRTDPFLP